MARNVKISTIGGPDFYLKLDGSLPYPEMWEKLQEYLTKQIAQVLPERPDLIVLTEMCDLPFEFERSRMRDFVGAFTDHRGGDNIRFFGRAARENRCYISFSTVTRGRGDYYMNTTFLIGRDGAVAGRYDKYYVTDTENKWNIRYGTEAKLIGLDFGSVACAICFDLNFDDLREKYKALKPDLILFSSMFHGGLMQQIWANECRAFFTGAIAHQRPSSILSPLGETLACSADYTNYATATINLDWEFVHLKDLNLLNELKRKYGTAATIYDPCHIGYFMLTCEDRDMTVKDMINEFGITSYDEYLAESRTLRSGPDKRGESAECDGDR